MSRTALIVLVGVAVTVSWRVFPAPSRAGQIKLATDRPKPLPVEESLKLFRLPKGFRMEVVASEPHLADPVAMDFDARGRIFVCEIHGYNLEGYYDILKLNKTGVLDRKVRRVMDVPEAAVKRAAKEQYGTVKLLDDSDGDGRMDSCQVWADRLPPCYGVVAARDGVIVVCPPKILFLADRDGDGKAEVREELYKTAGGPMWSRPSNPRWNLDNWIYYDEGARFKADGSAKEPATGNGQFGQAMSDWGDRFLIVQSQPVRYVVPLPHRYLARNPYHAAKGGFVVLLPYNDLYPISQPHPWRMKRGQDPAWLKFYGATEATPNGFVTSACGNVIYQATQFPPEYHGNYFFCENAQNMIHRCLLVRDGAGYKIQRAVDKKIEFLASTEQWFRPVNMMNGPDGALYVVDMYREIIEDFSAIPRFLQQQYVEALVAGRDRGRIYRLVAEGTPKLQKFDLNKASTGELVERLSSTNAWWRQTVQRLLVERGDKQAAGPLASLAREGKTPQARLRALCTLDGLEALEPELVERALGDSHFAVRAHALRLAEPWLDKSPGVLKKVVAMVDDPDPKVRLQLGLTLGESKDPQAVHALVKLASRYAAEEWMADAVLSSVAQSADRLLGMILERPESAGEARRLVHPLAAVVGTRRNNDEIGHLLATIARNQDQTFHELRVDCLKGLIEGLKRGKAKPLTSPEGQTALRRLLVKPAAEVQTLAVTVAGLVKLQEGEEMKKALAAASKVALDEGQTVEERQAAISLLKSAPYSQLVSTTQRLLDAREPLDIQLAAVAAISSADDPGVGSILLADFDSRTPKVQAAIIDAVFSRTNRLPGLLDAVQEKRIQPAALNVSRRRQLTDNPDPQIRDRARVLLAGQDTTEERKQLLARYQAALKIDRDAKHGREVFEKQCAKCHKLQGQGYEVGPDLVVAKTRADETLVLDVLDPGREITVGYQNYTVVTVDGRIFTGVLAAETATSITLRKEESAEEVILRKDIDEMAASSLSMMPEELEKEVNPKDVADLIAYLREALGPPPPPVVMLFEDDRAFAEVLTEGPGTVSINTEDRFSGTASLAVNPLQRSSSRIPGWEYTIAENPAPGEFRYLRFTWKARDAQGTMIELAAEGQWPPANKPLRRYYAGKNTTGWEAVQVSSQVPRDWVVVTRDLWKDFGSFTLTGIAPTAMGGEALFDRIELLRSRDETPGRDRPVNRE